mmetsp:Transcript_38297/g.74235  ORF Transcript_38297/g.74235 Transcript_38297/m.74235 type:complete len:98 (+) Transcript_38297:1613-1906(+)
MRLETLNGMLIPSQTSSCVLHQRRQHERARATKLCILIDIDEERKRASSFRPIKEWECYRLRPCQLSLQAIDMCLAQQILAATSSSNTVSAVESCTY